MSVSCFLAAVKEEKVPRLRRLLVLGFFLREYSLYSPDFNLRIIQVFYIEKQSLCQCIICVLPAIKNMNIIKTACRSLASEHTSLIHNNKKRQYQLLLPRAYHLIKT